MSKYLLNPDLLQIGDVICTRDDNPISHTIRKTLSCDYSHVMIYVAHSSCIHADGEGVHSINTQRLIFNDPNDVIVLRYNFSKDFGESEVKRLCDYPRSKVGTEYSAKDAIKSGISAKSVFKPKVESNYQFCSRLVAESFKNAGISISSEPRLCTPADIQKHPNFKKIDGIVREARKEEIDFAADKSRNTVDKQTKITNNIIKASQVIFGKKVQTFEEIYSELVISPEFDEKICSLIQNSGYLTLWADDILKCPERYFQINYQDDEIIKILNPDGLRFELELAEKDLHRCNVERIKISDINLNYPRKTFAQQINLYQILVSLALQRRTLFRWLLKKKVVNG